jgi:hypothetical protein
MTSDTRIPSTVAEITGTTTYTGKYRLFWIQVHATSAATITLGDAAAEIMSIYVAANDSKIFTFMPSIVVQTSLVITLSSGAAKMTTCMAPA